MVGPRPPETGRWFGLGRGAVEDRQIYLTGSADAGCNVPTTRVNPGNLVGITGRSHVVILDRVMKLAFVSGQVSMNSEGLLVGKGDFEAQTRQVFQNLLIILGDIGATVDDIVKLNAYTTLPEEVQTYLRVRNEFVNKKNPPASTFVGVLALASPDFLIEVEMVVVLRT